MTDKKQEFMDWLSKGYDDASEHMEIEGLALCACLCVNFGCLHY